MRFYSDIIYSFPKHKQTQKANLVCYMSNADKQSKEHKRYIVTSECLE